MRLAKTEVLHCSRQTGIVLLVQPVTGGISGVTRRRNRKGQQREDTNFQQFVLRNVALRRVEPMLDSLLCEE